MKRSLILLMSILMIFSVTACQSTLVEDIVVQKEGGIKEVEEIDTDHAEGDLTKDSIADYEVPESWKEEIQFDNLSMKINIDAKIEFPDVNAIPSYIVNEKAGLPQETIDALIDEFFGSATIYSKEKPRTKAELQQEILDMQLSIQEAKNDPDSMGDPAFMEELVKEYQEELKTAPDTVEDAPLEIDVNKTDKDGSVMFNGIVDVPRRGDMNFVYAFNTGRSTAPMLDINPEGKYLVKTLDSEELNAPKSISRKKAIDEAQSLLDRIGIKDMVLEGADFAEIMETGGNTAGSGTYGYIVNFVHEIDGIPSHSNVVQTASLIHMSQENYTKDMFYEFLSVKVTKDDILGLTWHGHFEPDKKEVENIALLPFEDIQKEFAQYMLYTHSYLDDPETMRFIKEPEKERTFHVHSIKLGYAKSPVKNEPGVYQLIPVWNFYAYKVDRNGVKDYDYGPCMSINAADGSIFN